MPRSARPRRAAGFTLLEMMLVVVIIGLLATVVIINVRGGSDTARIGTTKSTMGQVKSALDRYYAEHGAYPESLEPLATGPRPMLERIPQDAWRREFFYMHPSENPQRPFDLISAGPDGQYSTQDDIDVWTMQDQ